VTAEAALGLLSDPHARFPCGLSVLLDAARARGPEVHAVLLGDVREVAHDDDLVPVDEHVGRTLVPVLGDSPCDPALDL